MIARKTSQTRRSLVERPLAAAAAIAMTVVVAEPALAQFTGPSVQGQQTTVADVLGSRPGRYVTLVGNIVAHQRGDYYTFRDASGDIRVEIPAATFGGRQIGPNDRVQIMGELDSGRAGRYVWVKSLRPL